MVDVCEGAVFLSGALALSRLFGCKDLMCVQGHPGAVGGHVLSDTRRGVRGGRQRVRGAGACATAAAQVRLAGREPLRRARNAVAYELSVSCCHLSPLYACPLTHRISKETELWAWKIAVVSSARHGCWGSRYSYETSDVPKLTAATVSSTELLTQRVFSSCRRTEQLLDFWVSLCQQ